MKNIIKTLVVMLTSISLFGSANAGELAGDDVRFSKVWGLSVDQYNNRILTATGVAGA